MPGALVAASDDATAEVFAAVLASGGYAVEVVPEAMRSYFRDVEDHAIRVRDQVGSLDELLTSILQASLARTSQADNEDMRRISAWAGIIAAVRAVF